jgi:hypothetical protein
VSLTAFGQIEIAAPKPKKMANANSVSEHFTVPHYKRSRSSSVILAVAPSGGLIPFSDAGSDRENAAGQPVRLSEVIIRQAASEGTIALTAARKELHSNLEQSTLSHMKKLARAASGIGCLVSILGPLVALVLYPKANALFALLLIGVVVIVVNVLLSKEPTPQEVADFIERLMNGHYAGWDVDTFEHLRIRDPNVKGLWVRSISVCGLPETWAGLSDDEKDTLRHIIRELRQMSAAARPSPGA